MTSSFIDLDAAATSEDGAGGYFFELANRDEVVYRCGDGVTKLHVGQDRDIVGCTGGIVWETAFLLANYLRTHPWSGAASSSSSSSSASSSSSSSASSFPSSSSDPSVLEVGAGCGLLGLAMAKDVTTGPVVMTEAPEAMVNLTSNVDRNNAAFVEAPSSGGQAGGGGEGAGGSGGGGGGAGGGAGMQWPLPLPTPPLPP